ncbi:acyl-CoA dehydrogenase family protein [soil metagenome]
MTDSTEDTDVENLIDDFFGDLFDLTGSISADRNTWSAQNWKSTSALGLPLVGIDERWGGSGGTLIDTLSVLRGVGRYCVPLPLAETSLAAWLLAQAGVDVPDGPLTVMVATDNLVLSGRRLSGDAGSVPWASEAAAVVGVVDDPDGDSTLVVASPREFTQQVTTDLTGVRYSRAVLSDLEVERHPIPLRADDVFVRGALLRAALLTGAIEGAFALTSRYVAERSQFGRPIGAFQSVQAHTVALAEASIAARLVIEAAAVATDFGNATFEMLSAKSLVNEHARTAARASHQAHGAIGMTQEYSLHHFTRRLNAWRGEFGDERTLHSRLGEFAIHARSVLIDPTGSEMAGA